MEKKNNKNEVESIEYLKRENENLAYYIRLQKETIKQYKSNADRNIKNFEKKYKKLVKKNSMLSNSNSKLIKENNILKDNNSKLMKDNCVLKQNMIRKKKYKNNIFFKTGIFFLYYLLIYYTYKKFNTYILYY